MDQLNGTAVMSNYTTSTDPAALDRLVPAVIASFCFLVGVPGNIAVIVLKPNREHLSTLSQCLMTNLAVSDLLCLSTLPLWIYAYLNSWIFGRAACKMVSCALYCSIFCSLLNITSLSIQRYLQVVHQKRWLDQKGKTIWLLVALWFISLILSIPNVVVREVSKEEPLYCDHEFASKTQFAAVFLSESLLVFVFPFSAVTFAYIRIYRSVNQAAFFNNPQTTRLVASIIVTFFLLWTPYHVVNMVGVGAKLLENNKLLELYEKYWRIAASLTFVNSCLDPLLYAFASGKICTMLKNGFERKRRCSAETHQPTESSQAK